MFGRGKVRLSSNCHFTTGGDAKSDRGLPLSLSGHIINFMRPLTMRSHLLGTCNNPLKLTKLACAKYLEVLDETNTTLMFWDPISLSPFWLRCGTTLYPSNESWFFLIGVPSGMKRKVSRCTLMIRALPYGKAFLFFSVCPSVHHGKLQPRREMVKYSVIRRFTGMFDKLMHGAVRGSSDITSHRYRYW